METRYYIHVGDTTTTAGVVLTGLDSQRWHGHACAYEGDLVSCPACKSVGFIRCAGDRISATGPNGREQALSGDLCICRCPHPPRLLGSQSTYSVSGSSPADDFDFSTLADASLPFGASPTRTADEYDQRFLVVNDATGEPLKDRRYKLRYSGGELQGRTDAQGYTERVSGSAGESVEIDVFAEGA
jgi:uncharacterized Zn-binding protein involved in type VI secretion